MRCLQPRALTTITAAAAAALVALVASTLPLVASAQPWPNTPIFLLSATMPSKIALLTIVPDSGA
jgi:hypothetical protein